MFKNVSKEYYNNMLNHFINNSEESINKAWYLLIRKNEMGLYPMHTDGRVKLYRFLLLLMLKKNTKKVGKTALKAVLKENRYNIKEKKDLLYIENEEKAEDELIALYFNSPKLKEELDRFVQDIAQNGKGEFDVTEDDIELLESLVQEFEKFQIDPDKLVS